MQKGSRSGSVDSIEQYSKGSDTNEDDKWGFKLRKRNIKKEMSDVSAAEKLNNQNMEQNISLIIKKDYEARGGVTRGFDENEPSISEFSDTPKQSSNDDQETKKKTKRFNVGVTNQSESMGFSQVLEHSPSSPEKLNKQSVRPILDQSSLDEDGSVARDKKNAEMAREQELYIDALNA